MQHVPKKCLYFTYIVLNCNQVLILKLNKEAPFKKDVFRAPGHQGNMKKLVHFLQAGRLVNMDNFSVYTIASVLKKFLRKLPGGIFGRDGEQRLFAVIDLPCTEEQRDQIHRSEFAYLNITQQFQLRSATQNSCFATFNILFIQQTHTLVSSVDSGVRSYRDAVACTVRNYQVKWTFMVSQQ